jgi:biopolymer transport protein ExbD/biopolymer transport protein TolR
VNFSARRRPATAVDVTPLIDIIFQLVIFFMVSTTFITSPGIEVELPESSADTIIRERDDVKVWVRADGTVHLDQEPASLGELRARLSAVAKKDKNTMIVIKADKQVDHGRVVAVMDLARGFGLNRLAIATEANLAGGGGSSEGDD